MERTVLWQEPAEPGADRCRLSWWPGGALLDGTALLAVDGAPCEVAYAVHLDERWRTRQVEVRRRSPGDDAAVRVEVDVQGRWLVEGAEEVGLRGCVDVDLELTPATNTLPVRRLGLDVGAAADVDVAWLRFPGLTLERAAQRYTRLDRSRWEFRTGDFVAVLEVDDAGLVRRYGDAWRQVAARDSELSPPRTSAQP